MRPPNETMLEPAAPVTCAGALVEALAAGRDEAGGVTTAPPVELGMVELTPGTMGVTSVGTGTMGVALGTTGVGVTTTAAELGLTTTDETAAGTDETTTGTDAL
jgi:hypothetical protein